MNFFSNVSTQLSMLLFSLSMALIGDTNLVASKCLLVCAGYWLGRIISGLAS